MRTVLAVCAALLLPGAALASPDSQFMERCERDMKPVLEVHVHEAPFNVTDTLSSKVLNTRVDFSNASVQTMGVTSGTHRTEITLDAPALRAPGGEQECVSPRLLVDLAYNPVQVYVAREFDRQSCAYRTIFEHEMRHVQVYRDNLPVLEQRVRAALEQRYGSHPLFLAPGSGLARLEDDVDNWLRPYIRDQLAEVERQQALLDTPEETYRMSHACLGDVARAMGKF